MIANSSWHNTFTCERNSLHTTKINIKNHIYFIRNRYYTSSSISKSTFTPQTLFTLLNTEVKPLSLFATSKGHNLSVYRSINNKTC